MSPTMTNGGHCRRKRKAIYVLEVHTSKDNFYGLLGEQIFRKFEHPVEMVAIG